MPDRPPDWYRRSFLLLHLDHNYQPGSVPPPLHGVDRNQFAAALDEVGPDVLTCTAKGQSGLVPYPTRFGNGLDLPEGWPDMDVLAVARELTEERGIALVLGYAGLVDHHAAEWHPGWMRVDAHLNSYPNRGLCPNSSYVDELLLPQLDELFQRYRPDGFWLDGENWSVAPCWCAVCESEWQLQHERSAPARRGEPLWREWLEFHRQSFLRYLGRVARFLHEREPALVIASNAGFASHQPDEVPSEINRLTWDLSPAYASRQAGFEARVFEARGADFDLLTWTACSARPAATPRLPALPAYPKSVDHLCQDGAGILAHGGRWGFGLALLSDDAVPASRIPPIREAAAWARERRPWCVGTESAAYVAVLHGAAGHRLAGNGLYDAGPCLDRIRGAHQLLQELHHPHDVVSERALRESLERYRVVVLPEQLALDPDLDEPLTEWVRAGGRLVASGRVGPRVLEDIPTFALEEVLGVRWTGRHDPDAFVPSGSGPLRIAAPVYHVAPLTAQPVLPLLRSGHEFRQTELEAPALTRNSFGEGEAWYVAPELFAAYHRCQYPGLRVLFGEVLEEALPEAPLLTSAPPTVEIVWRRKDDVDLLHLIDHNPGKSLAQNNPYVESLPDGPGFTVTLRRAQKPASVSLEPGARPVEWSWEGGILTASVSSWRIHAVLAVE